MADTKKNSSEKELRDEIERLYGRVRFLEQQTLTESREHALQIINNTIAFVGMLAPDGTLLEANSAALQVGGVRREEVVGRKFWDCYWWSYDGDVQNRLRAAIARAAQGEIVRFDVVVRTAEDGRLPIDFMLAPERDRNGRVTHLIPSAVDISERKRAEDRLRESESKFRGFFEKAEIGMVRVSFVDARMIDANQAFCRMVGYSPDELRDISWPQITLPEDLDLDLVPFRRMAAGELDNYSVEKRFIHKDGHLVWCRLNLTLVRDHHGRPDYQIKIIEDISSRKIAEDKLRDSEQRFRIATEATGVGIWEWNVLTNQIRWDAQMFRIYGISPTEDGFVDYSDWRAAVLPEDLPKQEEVLQNTVRVGGSSSREFRIRRRNDHQYREIEAVETVRLNAQGQVEWVLGTNLDITERRRSEDALRESELFYRQTLDSIPAMVFTTRQDGFCDYVSPQWAEFTGAPVQEQLGDGWANLLHPEDRERALAVWRNAVDDRSPYDLEYRVRRRDGEYEWFKVHGRPIRNEAGLIVRWFGIALNIHYLFQTREELRQAKVEAEAASQAKSEFLANMSHEIRTPMTVFMAAIEHLLQIDRNPGRRHLLEMAEKSAERLRALIDDILDLSRIEARKLEIEEEVFNLRTLVGEVRDLFILPAQEKNLKLETEVAPETPENIFGDPDRLMQILVNLVGNAVKFTQEGEIRISVQPRGPILEISVADTGIGFPEEKSDLLFESFTQADSSFTRRYGGSGLGLSISKGLVELMGGELFVRRREKQGTIFTFTIPLNAGDMEAGVVPPKSQVSNIARGESGTRILLAEDDPMIREMIALLLAKAGWQTEIAENGSAAVVQWERGAFDLILMDLQMPEMNGLEATQTIREKEMKTGQHTCIVALTAHARREVKEECLNAGMDRVLTKPVQMKDLMATVEECISK